MRRVHGEAGLVLTECLGTGRSRQKRKGEADTGRQMILDTHPRLFVEPAGD